MSNSLVKLYSTGDSLFAIKEDYGYLDNGITLTKMTDGPKRLYAIVLALKPPLKFKSSHYEEALNQIPYNDYLNLIVPLTDLPLYMSWNTNSAFHDLLRNI